jgi:hypothetical protein
VHLSPLSFSVVHIYLSSYNAPEVTVVKIDRYSATASAVRSISFAPQVPARRAPTSSSYVILRHLRHPTVPIFERDLYIQGRDKNLITIGNKPVFPQSLILTSDRQVLVPQAFVTVNRFVTARSPAFPGTLSTVPAPLLKQLLRL